MNTRARWRLSTEIEILGFGASSDPLKLATMRYEMRARHELENQIKSTDEKELKVTITLLAEFQAF